MLRNLTTASMLACVLVVSTGARAKSVQVSPRDLSLQPHRLYGQQIEVRLRCVALGVPRYRCAAPGLRLDLDKITNDDGRERIESGCKARADAGRPRCLFTLRFISDGGRRGSDGITHIRARDGSAEIATSGSSD